MEEIVKQEAHFPEQYNEDLQELENAANAVGYKRIEKNSDYILYHIETPDSWGVVSSYRAVAIGSGAAAISMQFLRLKQ